MKTEKKKKERNLKVSNKRQKTMIEQKRKSNQNKNKNQRIIIIIYDVYFKISSFNEMKLNESTMKGRRRKIAVSSHIQIISIQSTSF